MIVFYDYFTYFYVKKCCECAQRRASVLVIQLKVGPLTSFVWFTMVKVSRGWSYNKYKLSSDELYLSHTQLYRGVEWRKSEMCSLHLTHPSAHTPGAVGSRHCGARGAVGGSAGAEIRTIGFPWVTSGFKSNALSIRPQLPVVVD